MCEQKCFFVRMQLEKDRRRWFWKDEGHGAEMNPKPTHPPFRITTFDSGGTFLELQDHMTSAYIDINHCKYPCETCSVGTRIANFWSFRMLKRHSLDSSAICLLITDAHNIRRSGELIAPSQPLQVWGHYAKQRKGGSGSCFWRSCHHVSCAP